MAVRLPTAGSAHTFQFLRKAVCASEAPAHAAAPRYCSNTCVLQQHLGFAASPPHPQNPQNMQHMGVANPAAHRFAAAPACCCKTCKPATPGFCSHARGLQRQLGVAPHAANQGFAANPAHPTLCCEPSARSSSINPCKPMACNSASVLRQNSTAVLQQHLRFAASPGSCRTTTAPTDPTKPEAHGCCSKPPV